MNIWTVLFKTNELIRVSFVLEKNIIYTLLMFGMRLK